MGMVVLIVGLLGMVVMQMVKVNIGKVNDYLYGLVCWVDKKDIQVVGLLFWLCIVVELVLGKYLFIFSGVYVGGWQDKDGKFYYLWYNGFEYVLIYVLMCFGKGVGLVVLMLFFWVYSVVIIDLKGELWVLIVGWWKKYVCNKVVCFELVFVQGSVCWNLFDEICLGIEYEVGDVQNFVILIVDLDGKGLELYWQKISQVLFVGVILYVFYKVKNEGMLVILLLVDGMFVDLNCDVGEFWMEMIIYGYVDGQNYFVVGFVVCDMMDCLEEEFGFVLFIVKFYLVLYCDLVVVCNVSKFDFCIK